MSSKVRMLAIMDLHSSLLSFSMVRFLWFSIFSGPYSLVLVHSLMSSIHFLISLPFTFSIYKFFHDVEEKISCYLDQRMLISLSDLLYSNRFGSSVTLSIFSLFVALFIQQALVFCDNTLFLFSMTSCEKLFVCFFCWQ